MATSSRVSTNYDEKIPRLAHIWGPPQPARPNLLSAFSTSVWGRRQVGKEILRAHSLNLQQRTQLWGDAGPYSGSTLGSRD